MDILAYPRCDRINGVPLYWNRVSLDIYLLEVGNVLDFLKKVGLKAGGTPERRFSAAKHGFNLNISFTFQAIQKLCAHFTILSLGLVRKCLVILSYIWKNKKF